MTETFSGYTYSGLIHWLCEEFHLFTISSWALEGFLPVSDDHFPPGKQLSAMDREPPGGRL